MQQNYFTTYINSPIGWLELKANNHALISISFTEENGTPTIEQPEILAKTSIQLNEYFEGKRKLFDLNLAPTGTDFQQEVWRFVKNIAYGETASYLDIAIKTGSNKNSRAVGLANGKNPIPIIIPCHRIIGSNGKLTGYAGGLERKRWLLHHELKNSDSAGQLF
jgi:methylated-DNA-[protein]-cysteine S-methyltransferase